jgi:putative transposase
MEGTSSENYILAVDEVVSKKAGKRTYGVNWFYSSIAGKAIRSISFHAISLVDIKREASFALDQIQNVKEAKVKVGKKETKKASVKKSKKQCDTKVSQADNAVKNKLAGRPKGSKNKQNTKEMSSLSIGFKDLLNAVITPLAGIGIYLKHVVADGAYGNKTCMMIGLEAGLDLISKLNRNSALFLPYAGMYSGKGAPRKYGEQLKYNNLPIENLKNEKSDKGIKTQIYQFKGLWSKHLPQLINVVLIQKTDIETKKTARVLLFSSDIELDWEKLIRCYSLRFQIEFNFRDAKQYFGLADLKNINEISVKNAVGMAFFMDNLSLILIQKAKVK